MSELAQVWIKSFLPLTFLALNLGARGKDAKKNKINNLSYFYSSLVTAKQLLLTYNAHSYDCLSVCLSVILSVRPSGLILHKEGIFVTLFKPFTTHFCLVPNKRKKGHIDLF